MKCPFCMSDDTKVTDKRDIENTTKRRRECLKCKKRFTTFERVEEVPLTIIKKDGRREQFSREKLRIGMMKACEKRPISREQIEETINEIETRIRKEEKEVSSKFIGELMMRKLKRLDKVAYIRFASIYKDFKDEKDFVKELKAVK